MDFQAQKPFSQQANANGVAEGLRFVAIFDKEYQLLWKPLDVEIRPGTRGDFDGDHVCNTQLYTWTHPVQGKQLTHLYRSTFAGTTRPWLPSSPGTRTAASSRSSTLWRSSRPRQSPHRSGASYFEYISCEIRIGGKTHVLRLQKDPVSGGLLEGESDKSGEGPVAGLKYSETFYGVRLERPRTISVSARPKLVRQQATVESSIYDPKYANRTLERNWNKSVPSVPGLPRTPSPRSRGRSRSRARSTGGRWPRGRRRYSRCRRYSGKGWFCTCIDYYKI